MVGRINKFYKGKNVLITGHTGFKGSWLSLWLSMMGARVVGYSLEPPTQPNLFDILNSKKILNSIKGDVRDYKKLKKCFDEHKPQIIFHMAAQSLVRASYDDPLYTYETNIMGTANLLDICRRSKSPKAIINVTSDKCYENSGKVYNFKENDPMGGFDPYSSSKGCSELISTAFLKSYFNQDNYNKNKVALASARAGNVIGGGDWGKDRVIPDCIRAFIKNKPVILRYPDAIRPWQYVLEPLYGYLCLGQALYTKGMSFSGGWNFGSDARSAKPVKWVVQRAVKSWGKNASWSTSKTNNPYESHYLKLDCSKAKTKLNWHSMCSLASVLDNTFQWYKAYYNNQDMLEFSVNQINNYEKIVTKRLK